MYLFLRRGSLSIILFVVSLCCYAQNEGSISVGLSLDYGFGKDANKHASTVRFNYSILNDFRVAPSFSYYINENEMKMHLFSLNFHYLFRDLISDIVPALRNQGLHLYPMVGFCVANISDTRGSCSSCSPTSYNSSASYMSSFGFGFGVGVEYGLPTLQPLLRNLSAVFEAQYHALDSFGRPSFAFGVLYGF